MTTLELYRTMTTPQLQLLQAAFRRDIEGAHSLVAITFCEQRLAWIDEVLTARDTPRYTVVPEHSPHGGPGWAVFDRAHQCIIGGWFADQIAAERTAAVQNDAPPLPTETP